MNFKDLFSFSLQNLFRSKLRTLLTTLGVAIGTGALVAMVSYGVGLQKTFSDEFSDLELFSSVRITSSRIDLDNIFSFSKRTVRNTNEHVDMNFVVLTDSIVQAVRTKVDSLYPGTLVYPETVFPAKVRMDTLQTAVMIEALPANIRQYAGYNKIKYGRFFESDSADQVVISEILLKRIGFEKPEAAINKTLTVSTISLDPNKIMAYAMSPLSFMGGLPLKEEQHKLKIAGVLSEDIQKLSSGFRMIIPIETSKKMRRLNFMSTVDLLKSSKQKGGYSAIIVRAKNQPQAEELKHVISEMGLNPLSFTDQFNQFKKLFLVFDLALAIIGMIALVVATLGITNTMIMSIMERYREIGIMKAVGASDADVRKIFFVESAVIGFMGGILGIISGKLVTVAINRLANIYVVKQAGTELVFFYFPFWLISSALFFAVMISLLAGMYPANRAARIEPVEALRYQ
ncbi:protein of unknown function DUF214 [Chloroherpeton thalassium ATCC 35110]|uniref:ABC3 transporter permease protein domain-containing protein n=1 Tax=Chloroherpeton thalassium (strain ATCC 35110 / GB-78) TaxID=517418 RepID=B3QRR5_CHLT3|nr:FtsX-like permease family protein [Chloroherpeton thalassium]ACF13868.1 protein of unknown function DUF214 [Chloroherpeton thalassium ATCC 35110]